MHNTLIDTVNGLADCLTRIRKICSAIGAILTLFTRLRSAFSRVWPSSPPRQLLSNPARLRVSLAQHRRPRRLRGDRRHRVCRKGQRPKSSRRVQRRGRRTRGRLDSSENIEIQTASSILALESAEVDNNTSDFHFVPVKKQLIKSRAFALLTAMKLPNGERADLGTKLEDYSLNPSHRAGRHKARVFAAVLGITRENQQVLREALLRAAATSDAAEPRGDNGFGEVFVLDFPLTTERNIATVRSVWIIRRGEDFPRLATCYIV